MSVEEEVELRDLVAQTLETNGCLAKLRAELRASIFLALDEDVKISKQQPLLNNKIKSSLETAEGRAMFCIVREFLEFFNLYFTISVFEPESYLGTAYEFEGREKTAKNLGLNLSENDTVPLLLQLIKVAQSKTKIDINLNLDMNDTPSNDIESDSNIKTETNASSISNKTNSNSNVEVEVTDNLKPPDFNATFDINSPLFKFPESKRIDSGNNETRKLFVENNPGETEENDQDTFDDTSSTREDVAVKSNSERSNGTKSDVEITQTSFKDLIVSEKPKLSPPKTEKLKTKSSLSSLSDLPPLVNKPRVNDILPSLYTKEFKDKSNVGLFDTEEQYEEDFMYSGDDLSLTSDYLKSGQSKINLLDGIVQKSNSDRSSSSRSSRIILDSKLPFKKPLKNASKETNGSSENSMSISEHLEVNNSPTASN